jgi:mono/diheme cytochrome c family protein
MRKTIWLLVVAVVLFLATAAFVVFALPQLQALHVEIPAYRKPGDLVKLEQGWKDDRRTQFHHTPQGTEIMRYKWFMALEQPCLTPFCGKFADQEYLGRFGFIAGEQDPKINPDGLPVGFARDDQFHDPATGQSYPVVGLNCAACHTAELHYDHYSVRVDGGPAMTNLGEFLKAIGDALLLTRVVPFRYYRFQREVLGSDATAAEKVALQTEFNAFLQASVNEVNEGNQRGVYDTVEGFGRTDALARIGNIVFAVDMRNWDNLAPTNAPVRFPQIWDASWLTWVQYNASISNPMERNVGEAMGVKAAAKLFGCCADKLQSSVLFQELWTLEKWLSGPAPYQGLTSPKWPAVFPALDAAKVAKGRQLYKERCEGCHLQPLDELKDLLAKGQAPWWKRDKAQPQPFLTVKEIPLEYIGTDTHQAMDFWTRTADSGGLNKGCLTADVGLDTITKQMAFNYYTDQKFDTAKQREWSGWQDPLKDVGIRRTKVYRPRPLNGVWALGTYLHNGSVPNLYQLLSPLSEREALFYTGSREFDPKNVGYVHTSFDGAFKYDTSTTGNSNRGHEFNGDGTKLGNGVIGKLLTPDERWAIIEFLKSM